MKIKHILVAGLAVMLLTNACSKSNDGGGSIDSAPDAQINLALKTSTLSLKASDDELLVGESNINNVGAAVFSADGSVLIGKLMQKKSDSGTTSLLNIPAKAVKSIIVLVANCPENLFDGISTYSQLQDQLAKLSDQSVSNMTMSRVITTTDELNPGDNYLGYDSYGSGNINGVSSPVEVTRLAARIDVRNVRTSFAGSKLAGRTVRIDEISIADQKIASRFFSNDYWGVVMVSDNLENSPASTVNRVVSDNAPIVNEPLFRRYVMENDGSTASTKIVVKATLLATPGYGAETKTFSAVVNEDGVIVVGQKHKYVKRNYVYRLSINFSNRSFSGDPEPTDPPVTPDPDPTLLDVKVEVVGWGPVTQDVVIE